MAGISGKDEGYCLFGAEVIQRRLAALEEEMAGVREARDIEYVHRMRVASRRLRAALPLFEACFPPKRYAAWSKEFRKITRALGAARDTDVQIEVVAKFLSTLTESTDKPGVQRLLLRLNQQRSRLQGKVIRALDSLTESGVPGELRRRLDRSLQGGEDTPVYTTYLYQKAGESIEGRLKEFLSYEEYISQPERIEELHAMRIAAKRLRYTLEIFSEVYPGELKETIQATRKVQDLLGEIHDADVWEGILTGFVQQEEQRTLDYFGHLRSIKRLLPGIQRFQEDRRQARVDQYERFLVDWAKMKRKGVWENLLAQVQAYIPEGEKPSQAAAPAREDGEQP